MGNPEFEDFARRELDGLLRYATVLAGDRELAGDLVQDVLLKAYRKWSLVAAAEHPRAYVRTMVTRAYLSWRRSWSTRNVVLPFDELPEGPPTGDHAGSVVDRDAMLRRLAELPRRQRSVLVLRYYEHLTDAEIADVLGCSAVTVRGYAARALASLRADSAPVLVTSTVPTERS
ncbi:SigE family RNA polymerase sigma factor [uncultured Jatrophihabitans sp.]|uniref:SigE family RNA polymerase sigma factor n=1 Tax=uncultured Jatrophihabitans sp. TaxID=1610747 RepID=UPI0035CA92CC